MTYGYRRSWYGDGGKSTLAVSGFTSMNDAKTAWEREAGAFGYTPLRWWMFWRWGEG